MQKEKRQEEIRRDMPFKSKAQQKYMFAKHPKIAKRWAKKYGVPKNLPAKKAVKGY